MTQPSRSRPTLYRQSQRTPASKSIETCYWAQSIRASSLGPQVVQRSVDAVRQVDSKRDHDATLSVKEGAHPTWAGGCALGANAAASTLPPGTKAGARAFLGTNTGAPAPIGGVAFLPPPPAPPGTKGAAFTFTDAGRVVAPPAPPIPPPPGTNGAACTVPCMLVNIVPPGSEKLVWVGGWKRWGGGCCKRRHHLQLRCLGR